MKKKSEPFDAFKKFKVSFEKKSGPEQTSLPTYSTSVVGGMPPSFLNEWATQCTRRLGEMYDNTERLEELTLFCLFADCEPIFFFLINSYI